MNNAIAVLSALLVLNSLFAVMWRIESLSLRGRLRRALEDRDLAQARLDHLHKMLMGEGKGFNKVRTTDE